MSFLIGAISCHNYYRSSVTLEGQLSMNMKFSLKLRRSYHMYLERILFYGEIDKSLGLEDRK